MIWNYIVTATRHLVRHKLFTIVNILGLSIGLAIYLFAQLMADYERSYDNFFQNADRTYALTEQLSDKAGGGSTETTGVHLALGPLLQTENGNIETWARAIDNERLVRFGDNKYYQFIKFVEPAFLDIFDFEILSGDKSNALSGPESIMLSETSAKKYFGDQDPVGKIINIDNNIGMTVSAVFKDLPANSHFSNNILGSPVLEMIATTEALANIAGWDIKGDFDGTSSGYHTYLTLAPNVTPDMVQPELDALYKNNMPDNLYDYYIGISIEPLAGLNTFLWKSSGMPIISTLQILGVLILLVACLNYTNLATVQVMGRTREVGLRRTMGAGRSQLMVQFLIESVLLALIALLLAVSFLDVVIPIINEKTGRAMEFDYISNITVLLKLLGIAIGVGLLAGSYPAMIISKGKAVNLLNNEAQRGPKGDRARSVMVVLQFTISIFMLVAVAIIYAQNQKIEESSRVFDKDKIVTLSRIERPEIREKWETLKNEMTRIDGVDLASYSRLVPYIQSNINSDYTLAPGDEASKTMLWRLSGDEDYLDMYDFKLLTGRKLEEGRNNDKLSFDDEGNQEQEFVNVVANQTLVRGLGFESSEAAIDQYIYQALRDGSSRVYRIVGIVEDKNFMGFFNDVKPTFFLIRKGAFSIMSLKINGENTAQVLEEIEETWDRINPEYPMELQFLDGFFQEVYGIFSGVNGALAIFAAFSMLVASIGLFGLAAFMAQKRTREIGIRKVLGASVIKITKLLVWQFSKPVVISIILAAPLGYFAASMYLDFFADRVAMSPLLFIITGGGALALAALTVSMHAIKAARQNPIVALRYE